VIILTVTLIPHVTGTNWDSSVPLTWHAVWISFLGLQDIIRPSKVPDYPVWSIAVEWHLYFFFPLLFWLVKRRFGRTIVLVSAALATAVLWIPWDRVPYQGFPPQFAFLFALGIVASTFIVSNYANGARVNKLLNPTWVCPEFG
jgi:peptidoglycan/LPS O-acetylase OafA/YrhL